MASEFNIYSKVLVTIYRLVDLGKSSSAIVNTSLILLPNAIFSGVVVNYLLKRSPFPPIAIARLDPAGIRMLHWTS